MALNLTPLMQLMSIQNKDMVIDKWQPYPANPFSWAQTALLREIERQYNLGLPVRIIVLKGRQVGISTATEGVLFNWAFLHPGARSLVIAHDTKSSQHLFGMAQLMWDTWTFRSLFTEKHASAKLLSWLENRSSMSVATARNTGSGRGFTYHAVHCSECAFWEDPTRLMVGLNQSVPYKHGTIIIIESTANGVGNWYHQEWIRAVSKESAFVPMFFPWYKHNEYEFPQTHLQLQDLDKEEREILSSFSSRGMTIPKIAWRRHCIKNTCLGDVNQFHQEYPLTPSEAFLSTGTNVFPLERLASCYHSLPGKRGLLVNNSGRLEFVSTIDGPLTIFKWPGKNSRAKYVVAGDPTHTTTNDYACIQILNRYTMEQVAVWRGHTTPVPFAHRVMELGHFYNTAIVNVEMEGPGYGSIAVMLEHSYPNIWRHRWADRVPGKLGINYGWSTNRQRKEWAIGQAINYISQSFLKIHDDNTYYEMENYVRLDGGEMGPADPKGFDDACMAMVIAIITAYTEAKNLTYETGTSPMQTNDLFTQPPWEAFANALV